MYKDICFIIHGKHIFAHKVILAARCDYFAKMFENKWKNKKYVTIKNILVSTAELFRGSAKGHKEATYTSPEMFEWYCQTLSEYGTKPD